MAPLPPEAQDRADGLGEHAPERRPVARGGVPRLPARGDHQRRPRASSLARLRCRQACPQPFWRSVAQRTHRSRRKIAPSHVQTIKGAAIVSKTLLPSSRHSMAQTTQATIAIAHQSLRRRSNSFNSGSIGKSPALAGPKHSRLGAHQTVQRSPMPGRPSTRVACGTPSRLAGPAIPHQHVKKPRNVAGQVRDTGSDRASPPSSPTIG